MESLQTLLDRLKAAQHLLLDTAASSDMNPSDGVLRKIAHLEGTIAAVIELMRERASSTATSALG